MTVTCRLLAKSDDTAFANPAEGVFDRVVSPALAAEFLHDERHHFAAALDGDRLVGMASGFHYVHPDKPARMFINEVGVSPEFRQHGIAAQLLSLLLDHGRRLGCTEAWVLTDLDNEAANALYRSTGGRAASPQMMYTFNFDDTTTHSA